MNSIIVANKEFYYTDFDFVQSVLFFLNELLISPKKNFQKIFWQFNLIRL